MCEELPLKGYLPHTFRSKVDLLRYFYLFVWKHLNLGEISISATVIINKSFICVPVDQRNSLNLTLV